MGGAPANGPARLLELPAEGAFDVWSFPARDRPAWRRLLSPEDVARAARCAGAAARREVVTSRAVQRLVAARYLGGVPDDVVVSRRCARCGHPGHGRPHVPGRSGYDYSVAHSGGLVLVAVTHRGRVGVDLEVGRRPYDESGVARLVCTPAERARLAALPDADRRARFRALWVRTEAVLKLSGAGIVAGRAALDVPASDGMVRLPADVWPAPVWVVGLAAGPLATAALAAERPITCVRRLGPQDLLPDEGRSPDVRGSRRV
ncbi:MAG: 4'-phosphopantetheinyl transferase family protein [Kineosporiaceae bacterium]